MTIRGAQAVSRPRDRLLLAAALVALALWLAVLSPVRTWAGAAGWRDWWGLGVAPNFFAGAAMALWQAFAVRSRPLAAATGAVALTVITEAAQFALPRYTPDLEDVVAGILGVGFALPLLFWRAYRSGAPTPGDRRRL